MANFVNWLTSLKVTSQSSSKKCIKDLIGTKGQDIIKNFKQKMPLSSLHHNRACGDAWRFIRLKLDQEYNIFWQAYLQCTYLPCLPKSMTLVIASHSYRWRTRTMLIVTNLGSSSSYLSSKFKNQAFRLSKILLVQR